MDFIKISLWLLLAMISVYKSECKSFHKYLASTGETSNEYDDNCFCFKNPGEHQIVPDILNQKNNNLERLVIYLYKDKITGQVKMYTPNEEKQALVPDLAFEVGDKLVTVDHHKIIDIFPHTINAEVDQQPHIANIVLPIEQNEFQYDDHVNHVHAQVDSNGVLSQENDTPDIYHINSYENYIDTDSVQEEKVNKQYDVVYNIINHNTLNTQPQVETNRNPSKIIDIQPELIYGDHDSSDASFEKFIPSKTNVNNFVADTKPASDWNILPDYANHGQHELPSVDYNIKPSKTIDIIPELIYGGHDSSEESFEKFIPSKTNVNNFVADTQPASDWNILPDNANHGQHELPSVDYNRKPSKTIDIIPELIYGGYDSSEASFEKFIPSKTNVNNFVADTQPASDWNILPDYANHGQHELPSVDYNIKPSKTIDIIPELIYGGHDSSEESFEKFIPSKTNVNNFVADTQPASDWNILPDYANHGQHELPSVDYNRKPSKTIDIIPELIYGGHDSSEESFEKFIPSETNINNFVADTQPASDWNILPDYANHGQHELPSVDYNRVPSNQINVPGMGIYPDNAQYENPYIVTNDVLEPLNMPGDAVDHDKVNYHVKYEYPNIDTIGVSKQINVPHNINYHGLQEQQHVDTISVLKPLEVYVPGEATYEQPYIDASGVSKQINVPGQAMYPDNVNYHGQHEEPYIDYMKVPKQTNVPFEVLYPDNVNYHAQHEQPHIGTDGVLNQPNVLKYPDVHYHVQHKQPLPETNDETEPINVPGEYIYDYFPHVYSDQGVPSKSSVHTFIIDGKPDGNWNIPAEWNYEHTLNPHINGKDYVYNIDGEKTANYVHFKSSEESGSSEVHNYEAIAESGSDQTVDSSEENTSESRTRDENNSIEYSQSNESDSSQENDMIESREAVKYSDELEMNAVIAGTKKYKTKSHNHSINQYETFDKWFIHQMQRFQTFTEHDKAINIVDIERYILNILYDNGMHVTSEGVLTDSFGTALDVHKLHLRPILIGNPLAVGSILKQITTDLVMPANMVYLQAILVTNAYPSMILGIIPIGKTVLPPSARNTFSTILKPHIRHDSSIILAKHPTLASSGKQHKSRNHWHVNKSKNFGYNDGKTVFTFLKKTPVIVHHRHRQPVKSIQIYGAKDKKVSFLPKNSAESVNKLMSSLSGPKGLLSSADATNKLLAALRSDGSLFTSSEESYESDVDEDDIAERIVGGSAATGSGAPLSMKGRMKDF